MGKIIKTIKKTRNKWTGRKSSLTGQKPCSKKFFCFCLLAEGMILDGCSLAVPQASAAEGGDRMIGAYITLEDLDLYDMDSFFQDHASQLIDGKQFNASDLSGYQQKLYATIDKCGSGSPSDWKVSFPDVEGFCFFSPEWTDEYGESYQANMYDSRISDRYFTCNTTDTGDEMGMSGKIYVAAEEYGNFRYYLNPVYQTPDGDIYLTQGPGSSTCIGQEVSEGGESGLSIEHKIKQTETDGKTETSTKEEKTTVSIKLAVIDRPVKITLCQMDADHKVLKKEEYNPKDVPEKLRTQEETAYILAEMEKESPSGEKIISRAVCENGKGEESMLESFCEAGNGVILKKDVEVEWQ